MTVERLTLVYDADGTLRGEITYVVATRFLGRPHCTLCDISHGPLAQKPAWKAWRARMAERGIGVSVVHRDEMPAEVRSFVAGRVACVVAHHSDASMTLAVTSADLGQCHGSVESFAAVIDAVIEAEVSSA